jgi:hypothetical protein
MGVSERSRAIAPLRLADSPGALKRLVLCMQGT